MIKKIKDYFIHTNSLSLPKNLTNKQPIKWKHIRDIELQNYLLGFMNSKPINGCCSNPSLAIIAGPKHSGKSLFIDTVINRFFSNQKITHRSSNLWQSQLPQTVIRQRQILNFESIGKQIIEYDIDQTPGIKFSSFIDNFQNIILNKLIKMQERQKGRNIILDKKLALQLLYYNNQKQLIKIYTQNLLVAISLGIHYLEPKDIKLINKCIEKLQHNIQLQSIWQDIIQATISYQSNVAAFDLARYILKQQELHLRPNYQISNYYISGIQSTDYLLDTLDYLCGLHPIIAQKIQQFTLSKKRIIQKGNHYDICVVLKHLDKLNCQQNQWYQWIDHLILRQYSSDRIRRHCPVIIQSEDSLFFKKQMFLLGNLSYQNVDIFEVLTVNIFNAESIFSQYLSFKETKHLYELGGCNLHDWQNIFNIIHKQPQKQLFSFKINQFYNKKHRLIFYNKINSLYLNPRLISYVDDGTIDNRIIDLLALIYRNKGIINTQLLTIQQTIVQNPITHAFIQTGILYDHFYYDLLQLQNQGDLLFIQQYLNQKRKHIKQKCSYAKWRILKGLPRNHTKLQFQFIKLSQTTQFEVRRYKPDTRIRPYHMRFQRVQLEQFYSQYLDHDFILWQQKDSCRSRDLIKKQF